ncbi:11737_t:CDS:2 [Dentiscutata heterogama]|uniref:11737_t:CDS:1 n=1 Tax=Dentiscutata heterogama TaxID=1316150 RepID=A0ACA9L786_9GLOM|nr:11737_t:CDS:2 [Dentiscutata heterogama]
MKTNNVCEVKSTIFTNSWALKENERKSKRQPTIKITTYIKKLLEIMFYIGTANPSQKLMAPQIREELIRHAQTGEIENNEIPKEAMNQNWISRFSHRWKEAMVLRALDETENYEPL